jgi:hypothetical protein
MPGPARTNWLPLEIPSHLSLPPVHHPPLNLSHGLGGHLAPTTDRTTCTARKETDVTTHSIGTCEEWLDSRLELLKAEEDLAHREPSGGLS